MAHPPAPHLLPLVAEAEAAARQHDFQAATLEGEVARLEGQVAELQAALHSAAQRVSGGQGLHCTRVAVGRASGQAG